MLIHLFADYTRDAELRARFKASPREVLEEYGLAEDDRANLLSSFAEEAFESALVEEIRYLVRKTDPEAAPYPTSGDPEVRTISPDQGRVGKDTRVTVKGTDFAPSATLTLRHPRNVVEGTGVVVVDQYRLEATVRPTVAGAYDVIVTNKKTGGTGSLPQAFTATT